MPEVTNLSDGGTLEQMPELCDLSLWSLIVIHKVIRTSISLSQFGCVVGEGRGDGSPRA